MPTYNYECLIEGGGCGQTFPDFREMRDRGNATCPNCMTYGGETFQPADGGPPRSKIEILVPRRINFRTQDAVERETPPGFAAVPIPAGAPGEVTYVTTEAQRQEAMKKNREAYYAATEGDHTVIRPFVDDRGRTVMDKVTTRKQGVDLGEIADVRDLKVAADTEIDRWGKEAQRRVEGKAPVNIPHKVQTALAERRAGVIREPKRTVISEPRPRKKTKATT